jgi:hypothetical protein
MAKLLTPFDRWMVQPGSMLIVLFGVILAVVQGFPLLGFLQGASANWLLVSWVIFALTIPLVPLIFIPRGKRFEAALQDAIQQGRVTEELTAAMSDPVDQAGHRAEEIAIAVVVFLMVVKPF